MSRGFTDFFALTAHGWQLVHQAHFKGNIGQFACDVFAGFKHAAWGQTQLPEFDHFVF